MINSVRNTVLAYINKDNRGYLTPEQFNLFAHQAQIDRFEQYMYDYNNALNKQNQHLNGSGSADIAGRISEVIDSFSTGSTLAYNGVLLNYYYPGTNPSDPDEPKYFKIERITYNGNKEIEKVSHNKVLNLLASNLTAPTAAWPVYTMDDTGIQVYPLSLSGTSLTIQYIRYPRTPKWTYNPSLLVGGEPLFDPSISDYQDFELPASDEPFLVNKILQYAGISIREGEVVQMAKADEVQDKQEKQ
jgi:hypothetical protein